MTDLQLDIIQALKEEYGFKPYGEYLRGECPACGKKEAFTRADRPYVVFCGRENKCGERYSARDLFPRLFERFSERYPATQEDPDASARAYLLHDRGFHPDRIQGLWHQGSRPLPNGQQAATARFPLWDAHYWERIIDADAARVADRKAHFSAGIRYAGRHWQVEAFDPAPGEKVYIVEGIFHAIALHLAGRRALAAFTCSNFPTRFVEAHQGKGIVWVLGYDNGPAGRKACQKYQEKLEGMGEEWAVEICPSDSLDWDECFRNGLLEKDGFWADCAYRGRLMMAKDVVALSYVMYLRRQLDYRVLEFENALYVVAVKDLHKALGAILGEEPDEIKNDLAGKGYGEILDTEQGRIAYGNACVARRISNCVPEFLHVEHNEVMESIVYAFRIRYANGNPPQIISFSGGALSEASAFNKALLGCSKFGSFEGGEAAFRILKSRWEKRVKTITTIPWIGYDGNTKTYVYQDFAYRSGREIKKNDQGYFETKRNSGVKTSMKSVRIKTGETFTPFWFGDYRKLFGDHGLVALGNLLATLVVQQIRAKYESWPFLEITGEKNAGKSTLIEFLWKLVGREGYEGIDPIKASAANRRRTFSQVSNLPVVLIEGDRNDGKDMGKQRQFSFDDLKPLFNGRGTGGRGLAQDGYETDEPNFQGAIVISQNAMVEGSDALMERIVHIHVDTTHKRTENASMAMAYRTMETERLCGFLPHVLRQEKEILNRFDECYRHWRDLWQRQGAIQNTRVLHNHAQMAAAVQCLSVVLPMDEAAVERVAEYLYGRALDRQIRLRRDPEVVAQFWDNFDYMEDALNITLNCAKEDSGEIWVNLPAYHMAAESSKLPRLDAMELKRQLPRSVTRPLQKNGANVSAKCHRHSGYPSQKLDTREKAIRVWKFEKAQKQRSS